MNIEKSEYPSSEEISKGYIKSILEKIKESESVEEIEKYKKIYKKNVPIFMRSYFSAYLLKQLLTSSNKRTRTSRPRSSNSMVTMFVSIGKNRKVFPKDLVAFFMTNLKLKRTDVREVKVLDSYSFVDIPTKFGKDAISKLSGMDYKGRKITVNFARKREKDSSKH